MTKYYARVEWAVEAIMDLRPEWTEEMAEDFLIRNQSHIRDRLVELGWAVIKELIHQEHYEEEYGKEGE